MKKLFDKTLGGYYVMSVVLGLLLAVSLGTLMEVFVLCAPSTLPEGLPYEKISEIYDQWDYAWTFLPIRLCNVLFASNLKGHGLFYIELVMVGSTLLSVVLFVMMGSGKRWRSKVFQAMGVALLVLFVLTAYSIISRPRAENAALAVLPILLTVIPLLLLKRSREKEVPQKAAL